jgi:hypothetical protein
MPKISTLVASASASGNFPTYGGSSTGRNSGVEEALGDSGL